MPALANTHAAPLKPYSRPVIIQPSKPPPDNSAVKVLKPEVFKAAIVVESYPSVVYPEDVMGRMAFRLPTGKALTAHQWKVYDFIRTIPVGKVTTYALVAKAIGSGSQAVGGALRANPFQPLIPCHRIIATTLFIGGFQGEWIGQTGKQMATKTGGEDKVGRKLALLKSEGVEFDGKGFLVGSETVLWRG